MGEILNLVSKSSGQDAGDHRAGILQNLVKVQAIDIADQFDQVHVQINSVVIAAANF